MQARTGGSAAAASAVRAAGGSVRFDLPIVSGVSASVSSATLDALAADRRVAAVTPDERVSVASDGGTGSQTKSVYSREIRADELRQAGVDGTGSVVALIDTGISPVDDLRTRIMPVPDPYGSGALVDCVNFSGEATCEDTYGHGTFVAGLIAGTGAASGGEFTGVAPGARVVSVKIAGADGSADVSKVLAAIQWVVSFSHDLGIRVLNLSLGTDSRMTYHLDPLNFAVERAWMSGIAVVVSASNRGPASGTISKPADDPLVITVGAIDDRQTPSIDDDRLPAFSGRGPTAADGLAKPDVVAPGGHVISVLPPNSTIATHVPAGDLPAPYHRGSGTSMSAGVVSGAAALLLQARPLWTPDRLKFALASTAHPVASRDPLAVGAGLLDVASAMFAPAGLANQTVAGYSDGTGPLDGSRGSTYVSHACSAVEALVDPMCDRIHGQETAQDHVFQVQQYTGQEWTRDTWSQSQWVATNAVRGSSWYGSSWYGSSWYGSSWYGSSWYGTNDDTRYGTALAGSSWYGAWG